MAITVKTILSDFKPLTPIPTCRINEGSKLQGIKAVIFDIYGTLLVSGSGDVGTSIEAGSSAAFIEAFHKCGVSIDKKAADVVKDLFFKSIRKKHETMKKDGYPHPEIDIIEIWRGIMASDKVKANFPQMRDLEADVVAAAYEYVSNPVYPMPFSAELLKTLQKADYKMGIISNAQFYTPIVFEHFYQKPLDQLGFLTELCLFSYIEKRSKPDTALFDELTTRLSVFNISPSESVFIGNDMLKDILPAYKSGYKTILFAGDKRSLRLRSDNVTCRNIKPDVIVNDLKSITDFIQEG